MKDFIDALKRFVNVEYDTQIRQIREMWHQPLGTRVAEGEAIADLAVIEVRSQRVRLRFGDNASKFRRGDTLRLSQGDPEGKVVYRCTVEDEHEHELVVSPGYGTQFSNALTGRGWVLDRDVVDVRHILLGALDMVAQSPDHARYMGIISGTLQPQIDDKRLTIAEVLARTARRPFNSSQHQAFAQAYATNNYAVIQGPPGTGKTAVLAHLAASLAREGQRVLITSATHRAINNALRTTARDTNFTDIFKIGERADADELTGVVHNFQKFSQSPYRPDQGGLIVGGTCFAVHSSRLKDVAFDTVIFDEAGQVTIPLALAGMLVGQRYIFIGDHKQMAPVITGQHHEARVKRSIFETLESHSHGTMLNVTYRMNAAINAFPSARFYKGQLETGPDNRYAQLKLQRRPERYQTLLDPASPDVFAVVQHMNRGMRSPEEAELVVGLVEEAIRCGVEPKELAVVAPYRAQGRLIRQKLRQSLGTGDAIKDIVVDTVERIQGQEREMVIVSLTTSDPGYAAQRAGFYFQPNRLNVAITRPKHKRIVVGSPLLFSAAPPEAEHQEWVDHYRALYRQSSIIEMQSSR